MRQYSRLAIWLVGVLLPSLAQARAAAPTPPELAAQVQRAYRQRGDMTAAFTQIYHDPLRHKTHQEQGHVWVKQDGRIRWSYEVDANSHSPNEPKDFIFDGKRAFFYEPRSAQVTVFEKFADSPLAHAMQFLWGAGDLLHNFNISTPPNAVDQPAPAADSEILYLVPKSPMAALQHLYLVVHRPTYEVRQTRLVDALGNQSDYIFSQLHWRQPIDAARFAFTIPPDVSILQAPAAGP